VTDDGNPFAGDLDRADRYNDWIFERCRPHLGPSALDFGAGIGTFTERLAAVCARVVAAAPLGEFVGLLRERFAGRPNVEVVELDPAHPEAGLGGGFDAILCLNVLEHIADDEAALRAMRDQLAPGGRLLLLVPAHPFLHGSLDRNVGHERRYEPGPLRALLERAGFEAEEARLVNPLGALGWLVSSRLLRRRAIGTGSLLAFDRLVPLLRGLDRLRLPLGLSVWAVARRPR
jgi:SAM-dependent methyltransferase